MDQSVWHSVWTITSKQIIMRTVLIILVSAFCLAATTAQEGEEVAEGTAEITTRVIDHHTFQKGEKLTYSVSYGIIDAGEAVIEVKKENKKIGGRNVLHVVGTGESKGAFNWFFKVRDRYETFLDEEGVYPLLFIRQIHEGGYKKKQNYIFHQKDKKVEDKKGKKYDVPFGVQDMISSFYYSRTLDYSNAKVGDIFTIPTFVDNKYYPLQIKFIGRENVEVSKGHFRCLKFVPVVQKGRIFKDEEDMIVWVTDDENKIPVLAQAKVLVGSIDMELEDYEGLANPIAKVK